MSGCFIENATIAWIDISITVKDRMNIAKIARLWRCWRLVLDECYLTSAPLVDFSSYSL
jgi:hypothetical protein